MNSRIVRVTGGAALAALLGAGCSIGSTGPMTHGAASTAASTTSMGPGARAAELRTSLNSLLSEHALLAASATGAALGGRDVEFKAAAAALDANSVDLATAVGSVYGQGARDAFLPLWRKHIGFFVDYTVGVATRDRAKQDQAVSDLVGYTQDLAAFLGAANPNLPTPVVADLVRSHVLTLKSVVDAQAAADPATAYARLRAAAAHMQMIADPLAAAIAKQFPGRYVSVR